MNYLLFIHGWSYSAISSCIVGLARWYLDWERILDNVWKIIGTLHWLEEQKVFLSLGTWVRDKQVFVFKKKE